MRYWLIIIALSVSNLVAIDNEINGLKTAISVNDPRKINQALVTLQLTINQMEPIDSPVEAPSAERIKARQKIMQTIEPIKNELIELTNNPDSTVAQTATSVLGWAAPSPDVYAALKGNLENSNSPGVAASSLIALSKAGLMNDEVGSIAARRIGEYRSSANADMAWNLIRTAALVPVPQATDQLIEIIKTDNRIGAKMTAISALMELGPQALVALPEIEKLLQQLEEQGGDFRDINRLKRAIMLVSGRGDVSQAVTPAQPTPVSSTVLPVQKQIPSPTPMGAAEAKLASPRFGIVFTAIIAIIIVGVLVFLRHLRI